ncbi:galactose-specific lectin nattectin-like [Sphaeramia orbicularis]|uniref:galactose-specific lectin nattectin-like n=1 Tax=Sphaeramia orbicularis TaxID=375764 RepID=UPI001180841B|nr:galactose-specific lectin nattectin-like [Sphaeramia orbicularis]
MNDDYFANKQRNIVKRSARCTTRNTWYRYGNNFYIFVQRGVNWVVAQRICVSAGGSLVSLRSAGEENFVKRLTKNRPAWIGLSDAQKPGQWFWKGGTCYRYTNWCRGEPSNNAKEACAVMNVSSAKC